MRKNRSRLALLAALAASVVAAGLFLRGGSGDRDTPERTIPDRSDDRPSTAAAAAEEQARTRKPREGIRPHSLAPLPPPDAPLARTFDDLRRRADAGDGDAATRLAHDLRHCVRARRVSRMLPTMTDAIPGGDDSSAEAMQARSALVDVAQNQLQYVHASEALCSDLDPQHLDDLLPATLRAAELGDAQAAGCYLSVNLRQMDNLVNHPEWIAQFRTSAPALLDAAAARGDGQALDAVRAALADDNGSLLAQLIASNPSMHYRYLALERSVANGEDAQALSARLEAIGASMSAEERSSAERWAAAARARLAANHDPAADGDPCPTD